MSWQRFYKIWDNIGSCLWSWHGSSPLNHNNHQHIQPFSMVDWSGDSITRSSLQSKNSQRDDQTSMFAQSSPKCQRLTTDYQPTQTQRFMDPYWTTHQKAFSYPGFYKPISICIWCQHVFTGCKHPSFFSSFLAGVKTNGFEEAAKVCKSIEQSWNRSSAAAQPGDNEQKSIMKQVLSKQWQLIETNWHGIIGNSRISTGVQQSNHRTAQFIC